MSLESKDWRQEQSGEWELYSQTCSGFTFPGQDSFAFLFSLNCVFTDIPASRLQEGLQKSFHAPFLVSAVLQDNHLVIF